MYSWGKSLREDRLKRNPPNPSLFSSIPSFSSTLLDEIYRSIDDGREKCEELKFYKNRIVKKQSNGGGLKAKASSSIEDEEMASLQRACLVEKWMEKKVNEKVSSLRRRQPLPELNRKSQHHDSDPLFFSSSSSSSDSSSGGFSSSDTEYQGMAKSRTSCFTVSRPPKPVRTSVSAQLEKLGKTSYNEQNGDCLYDDDDHRHRPNQEESKHDDGLIKSKLRALKIYSNLKKVKQPISPGGRLASFLNSLFTNGNAKKTKNSSSSIGGYDDACVERKTNSAQTSTCSSASSYSRSCLTKTSLNSKEKSNNGVKRTVRFCPVSVIVDEDCRPCGHKCIYKDEPAGKFGSRANLVLLEKNRKIEEAARDILKVGAKKDTMVRNKIADEDEDGDDDAVSDSSSDLFELDHLAFIGYTNNSSSRYCQDLPVYETTRLDAIANGLIR